MHFQIISDSLCCPRIYWKYCAAHTLTMENVGYLKVTDKQAIESAGISAVDVSKKVYNICLRQIFETHFVSCSPM